MQWCSVLVWVFPSSATTQATTSMWAGRPLHASTTRAWLPEHLRLSATPGPTNTSARSTCSSDPLNKVILRARGSELEHSVLWSNLETSRLRSSPFQRMMRPTSPKLSYHIWLMLQHELTQATIEALGRFGETTKKFTRGRHEERVLLQVGAGCCKGTWQDNYPGYTSYTDFADIAQNQTKSRILHLISSAEMNHFRLRYVMVDSYLHKVHSSCTDSRAHVAIGKLEHALN